MQLGIALTVVLILASSARAGQPSISWSFGPVMPMAQTALGTTVVGDSIVVVGGTTWVETQDRSTSKTWFNHVHRLDIEAMQWSRLPDYPLPIGYAFTVGLGGKLFVIGGRSEKRGYTETFVLDLGQQNPKWTPSAPLPRPRWGDQGGSLDGVIYIVAGTEGDLSKEGGVSPAFDLLALDTRDPTQGWRRIASLQPGPTPHVEWRAGAVSSRKLYLFGGLKAPDPIASEGSFVRAWHNFEPWIPQTKTIAFDIESGQWEAIKPLPISLGSSSCIAVGDDRLLITGGIELAIPRERTPDGRTRAFFSNRSLLYDVKKNRYQTLNSLPLAVADHGSVYVQGRLYIIGGEDSGYKTRTDFVQIGRLHQ